MYDEFEGRGVPVIAIAQEDKDLESHGKFHRSFKEGRDFELVADLHGRETTGDYDRTTTYLIGADGRVKQVFPHLIHHRGMWEAILREVDRLEG